MGSADGIKKVEESNGLYAYFMEEAPIEYQVERKCNLTQVNGLLDSKGYAIATQKSQLLSGIDSYIRLHVVIEENKIY